MLWHVFMAEPTDGVRKRTPKRTPTCSDLAGRLCLAFGDTVEADGRVQVEHLLDLFTKIFPNKS